MHTEPPSGLNLALTRSTADHKYQVELHPLIEQIGVNQMHAWEIKVATPSGEPVTHARIEFGGGMPQHGHGFPTQPRVTEQSDSGHYLLEGMKFSMTGWWEIKLNIDAAAGRDQVTFNTVIALPKSGQQSAMQHQDVQAADSVR